MKNYMILALVNLFIVRSISTLTHAEHRRPNILKNNAVKRQDVYDTSFLHKEKVLNPFQNFVMDSGKGGIPRADRLKSTGVNRMKLNDEYDANNDIRIEEPDFKVESSMKSISSKSQQEIDERSRRVKRDTQTENQNTTDRWVVCEVSSLSCRNCCEGSINCSHKTKFCRCDPQCTFYNDCCADYETFCGKKLQISFGVDPDVLSCTQPKNVDLKSDSKRIWMVNKCPENRKTDVNSQRCKIAGPIILDIKHIRENIPVISKNNITFRNEFCAKCNGIEDFEYFGLNMKCYVAPPASITSFAAMIKFVLKYCTSKEYLSIFRAGNQPIRECNQYFRDTCPTLKELNERCNQRNVSKDECISKNHWCDLNLSIWNDNVPDECTMGSAGEGKDGCCVNVNPFPPSLTVALRLSKLGTISQVRESKCPSKSQFYDPYLETCRVGQSISLLDKQNFDKFDVAAWFDVKEKDLYRLPTLDNIIFSLAQLFNFNCSQVTANQDIQHEHINEERLYKVIRFELQLTNEQTLRLGKGNQTNDAIAHFGNDSEISTKVLPLRRLLFFSRKFNLTVPDESFISFSSTESNYMTLTVFKVTSRQLACIRKQTYPKGTFIPIQYGAYYYINSTGKTFAKKQVFFEEGRNESISVCEQFVFATCVGRRVNLTSEEYVKFDNLSIFYNRTKTIYDFGEYDIEDGQIYMCISETSSKIIRWIPADSLLVESYLTFACFILSLFCLFLVIQTYLVFPELRNLPGKNILSLSVSLFLAQLLWLVPDRLYPSIFCHIVAVIKHYLFLVSFFAMATIAWDTYSAFAGRRRGNDISTKRRENKKFYKYSAFVWGLPALFVVTCAVVDQKDIYAVYVNELLCWFDNTQAQGYLFALPIGVLLLFNVVLFALTVFRIQRDRSTTRLVRANESNRVMFWIYLKLSALMGFSWLFGFMYLLVGTPVFSYLFVIFASLQGVYIALAFVMKKAVWKKYKKLFGRKKDEHKPDYRSTLIENLSHSKETKV